jgi:hypothetical protein
MNCQPSFRTGSIPIVGLAVDDLGWAWTDGGVDASGPRRERPQRRVPDRDIIHVGRARLASRRDEPVDVRDLAYADAGSIDPRPPAQAARTDPRRYTKFLVALLILEITTVGGLYLKHRYAETQVILIPATVNERAVIT